MNAIIFKTKDDKLIELESDSGYIVRDLITKIIEVYKDASAKEIEEGILIFKNNLQKRDAMEIVNNCFKYVQANEIDSDALGILQKHKINML